MIDHIFPKGGENITRITRITRVLQEVQTPREREPCEVAECDNPRGKGRHCPMHAGRVRRGTPLHAPQARFDLEPWPRMVEACIRVADAAGPEQELLKAEWAVRKAAVVLARELLRQGRTVPAGHLPSGKAAWSALRDAALDFAEADLDAEYAAARNRVESAALVWVTQLESRRRSA